MIGAYLNITCEETYIADGYRYSEDSFVVTDMVFELNNREAGEFGDVYWRQPLWDILPDVEEAAYQGCIEDGKPWPEDLCRRWGERFGIGPNMGPREHREWAQFFGLDDDEDR